MSAGGVGWESARIALAGAAFSGRESGAAFGARAAASGQTKLPATPSATTHPAVRNAITHRRYPATIGDQARAGLYIRTTSRSALGRFDCSTPDFNMARKCGPKR